MDSYLAPQLDSQQDLELLSASETGGMTSCTFRRLLSTGDLQDRSIKQAGGVSDIIWATHTTDDRLAKHAKKGSGTVDFALGGSVPTPSVPAPIVEVKGLGKQPVCSSGGEFCLWWEFVNQSSAIQFTMESDKPTGYVSLGFGDILGVMAPADMYAGWVDTSGQGFFTDRYLPSGYDSPELDAQQDGVLVSAASLNGKTRVVFRRSLDTGDVGMDRAILLTGNNIIWATHDLTPLSKDAKMATHSSRDRGSFSINFYTGAIAGTSSSFPKYIYVAWAYVGTLLLVGVCARLVGAQLDIVIQRRLAPPLPPSLLHSLCLDFATVTVDLTIGEWLCIGLYFVFLIASALVAQQDFTPVPQEDGEVFGAVAGFNLMVSLLPVTRHSLWAPLLGCSFERAIKFHRWVARGFMLNVLLHALEMCDTFGFSAATELEPNAAGEGNLYGTIAAILMAVIMLGALEPVRRHAWEVFLVSHMAYLPTLVLICLHATDLQYVVLVSIALYAADMMLRTFTQTFRGCKVLKLEPVGGGTLRLKVSTSAAFSAGQYMFLRIPAISSHEMHPFSISSSPWPATQHFITFHIKSMGAGTWTEKLLQLSNDKSQKRSLKVFMDGPYGAWSIDPKRYPRLVLVAGGIGITPLMSLLTDLLAQERTLPQDTSVHLMWSSRDLEAFTQWFPEEIAKLQESKMFHLHLFLTQKHGTFTEDIEMGSGFQVAWKTGRPNYSDLIVESTADVIAGDVGVFACGPAPMVASVQSEAHKRGFMFHKETFFL